jgi:hypothetical protein
MSKILLMILLIVISDGAIAVNWLQIADNDHLTVFFDTESSRVKGSHIKMWTLINYKTIKTYKPIGKEYLSLKTQDEYDCEEERSRTLYSVWYSEHFGKGEVVYSSLSQQEWQPVIPGSFGETGLKIACLFKQ